MAICLDAAAAAAIVARPKWLTQSTRCLTNWSTVEVTAGTAGQRDRETVRQTDRQGDRETGRQADRETNAAN